jgi:hypothetical protein
MGLVGLVTKLTSLSDVRALLFITGFGLAAFGCFWAANRLRRASLAKVDAEAVTAARVRWRSDER